MITRDQIPDVLDHPVYSSDGRKIGEAKHVFVDDATGDPEWVTVKTGVFASHETFVPIREAQAVEDHLEVPYSRDTIKGAPQVGVDTGGHLSEHEEHRLYDHYGLERGAPRSRAGGPGEGAAAGAAGTGAAGAVAGARGRHRRGAPEAPGDTGTPGAPGMTGREGLRGREGPGPVERNKMQDAERGDPRAREGMRTGAAEGPARRPDAAAERRGTTERGTENDFLTRSEEHLNVHTERRESGHARLRKYVVTEEEQISVPIRRERVRLEREPITEANRKAATAGSDFAETEYEVTLHEERPVVEKRVEPVERVRLRVEETTENRTVRGRVRKERIDAESDTIDEQGRRHGNPKL
ncbi:PRC and DUF2382 domain-containing protein [Streptomyces sp. WMMC1477]|uniref:PRC and DUF2382 domain-containing protein n=1 Tax=Streptomyces sp. WMMC1477 TaxID=3015155 RepID=UPI0022B666FE|nr:PRC and DUF2382 domain-containing protein [Streptomyces sp. WMMC1477]MCZ7434377.1 PRC and DUF2382 domain-containing protein [Streptomyces sp. WMMC1477]